MNEKKDALKDALDGDFPDAFRFESEGETLIGTVQGFGKGFSKYGPHPAVQIQSEDDGEIYSVHCLHTVLRNQMVEADPKPGDRIAVRYLGEAEATKGKRAGEKYKNFRVRIDAANQSFADIVASTQPDDDMPF